MDTCLFLVRYKWLGCKAASGQPGDTRYGIPPMDSC